MGNPIPTLKTVLILMIAINLIWFSDRLFSLVEIDILALLPALVVQLLGLFGNLLLLLFNVLLLGLLSRLQLKPE
ncbi:MAG: hypothetical protein Q8R10_19065 [Pseudomonas sp.]|uniref:hypothetical protein n=1 Tax=Pseudomonas sp. TaxID=306 RepID=UPI002736C4BC|nr:hypothetical protein [Pseudomonas sp.]MDP3848524.1 hypothetical protein [Pseudomonas sp.]